MDVQVMGWVRWFALDCCIPEVMHGRRLGLLEAKAYFRFYYRLEGHVYWGVSGGKWMRVREGGWRETG